MKLIRKLFGGIDLTWPKLIIWAVAAGVLVGGIMLIPVSDRTSLKDIGTNFEWWIFFGIIIVSNSKNPIDSAAKAFVFFLISQPLIYLVQVPFSDMGWDLFGFYQNWVIWTLLTIPMGAVGHFVKRGDLISSVILSAMTVFLAEHMLGYARTAIKEPPHHLVSAILCAVFIVLSILGIARTKYAKIAAWLIAAGSIAVMILISVIRGGFTSTESRYTFKDDLYGIDLGPDSQVVVSVNAKDAEITEFNGSYYLHITIPDDENSSVTISTNGTEKTYRIRYSDEKGVTVTPEE